MELDKIPQWMLALEEEDAAFLKNFLMKSGSLKDIAKLYGVSYPTVRLRLAKGRRTVSGVYQGACGGCAD